MLNSETSVVDESIVDDPSPCQSRAAPQAPSRTSARPLVRNALWNWLGAGVDSLVAILLTPFLIRHLGDSGYGTWIVIGSLTGYLGVLDFGLRGSVGRHVAFYHARHDRDAVLSVLNTAGFVLVIVGIASFGMVAIMAIFFDSVVAVPAALLPDARLALLIVGLHLALWFVMRIFDATLWGYQRFDLMNIVDIPAGLLRGATAAVIVASGYGLVGLAWSTLGFTLAIGIAKLSLCRLVDGNLRVSLPHLRRSTLRELWGYGVWNFVGSLAGMGRTQFSPVLVGAFLGVSMVTPFSIVTRLLGVVATVMGGGTGVIIPLATALHAQDDTVRLRRLFIDSSKLCVAGALYFFALFAFLGRALLTLWIGPHLAWAWLPLVVLACGELLPLSFSAADILILGTARNRPLALRTVAECAIALPLAALLSRPFGLAGVCAALALLAALRGLFSLWQGLQIIGISPRHFFAKAVIPVYVGTLLPTALLALAVGYRVPDSWPWLCVYTGSFSVAFGAAAVLTTFGFAKVRLYVAAQLSPGVKDPV